MNRILENTACRQNQYFTLSTNVPEPDCTCAYNRKIAGLIYDRLHAPKTDVLDEWELSTWQVTKLLTAYETYYKPHHSCVRISKQLHGAMKASENPLRLKD